MNRYFRSLKDLKPKEPVKGIAVRSVYLENTMLTHMEFEPGSVIPEHKHPHEQITLILEGGMDMTVEGEKKTVLKGDMVSVPANVVHGARVMNEFTVAVDAWSPVREDYK